MNWIASMLTSEVNGDSHLLIFYERGAATLACSPATNPSILTITSLCSSRGTRSRTSWSALLLLSVAFYKLS
jgi:hypothetical protein